MLPVPMQMTAWAGEQPCQMFTFALANWPHRGSFSRRSRQAHPVSREGEAFHMKMTHVTRRLNLFVLVSLLVGGSLLSACGENIEITIVEKEKATETGTETLNLPAGEGLSLTIHSGVGDVRIQGADDAETVTIDYTKIAYGETEEDAQTELAAMTLEIAQENGAITIDAIQRAQETGNTNQVELVITAPRNLALAIDQGVGSVELHDLTLTGPVSADTGVGDIRLTSVNAQAALDLTTGVGSISYEGALGAESRTTVKTSTGDITLRIPADQDGEIDARTEIGDITTSGLTLRESTHTKEIVTESLTATLGDGGPMFHLRADLGSISIKKS